MPLISPPLVVGTLYISLTVCLAILSIILILNCLSKKKKNNANNDGGEAGGIAGNPMLLSALQKSFAYQAQAMGMVPGEQQGGGMEEDCGTCAMIQMGSSMPYSDNSCPQCGRYCG